MYPEKEKRKQCFNYKQNAKKKSTLAESCPQRIHQKYPPIMLNLKKEK